MIQEPVIRITSDGSQRVTAALADGGAVRITELQEIEIPVFDIAATIDVYFPGIVVQRSLTEAVTQWLIDHDGAISEADAPAILAAANAILDVEVEEDWPPYVPTGQPPYPAALPPLPAPLPRFPDSNPAPDGWSIVTDEKVVRGRP